MRRTFARLAVFLLAPAALVAAAFLQASDVGIAITLRNATFDAYQRAAPRDYQPAPVRVIDIDDESLERIGQWPWSRIRVSRLIERARAAGVSVLAFDVVFAERDRTAPRVVIPEWTDDPALQARAELLPDPDEVLAYAMRGGDLVTGFALTGAGGRVPAVKAGFVVVGDEAKLVTLPSFGGAVTSLPDLEAAAAGNGALNFISDKDGVVRSVPIVFRHGEKLVPSLAAEALRLYLGAQTIALQTRAEGNDGIAAARIGRITLPTDAKGQVWIHYSPPVPTRTVSAWKLLEPAAPGHEGAFASLEGAIAIVGTSAAGLKDLRFSPLGESIPGVEMHAQLLEQALGDGPLVRPSSAKEWETIGMAVLGSIVVLLVIRFGSIVSATVGLAALAIAWMASWQAFVSYHMLFDPLLPS
ncbi:MAG: CHASE2 domain-containing protein, partial [Candidatus Binatia bacterium]